MRALRIVLTACSVAVIISFAANLGIAIKVPIAAESMKHQSGYRYWANLPVGFAARAFLVPDSNWSPAGSATQLLENGIALGSPHSDHASIAELGGGRFSHWGSASSQHIYLSSSDQTDPSQNGRVYTAVLTMTAPLWLAVAAVVVLMFLWGGRYEAGRWIMPAAAVVAALVLAAWAVIFRDVFLVQPDSFSYINSSVVVPLGYPTFVSLVADNLGYAAVPKVQLLLFFLSAGFLSLAVLAVTRNHFIAAVSLVAVASYSPLTIYGGYVLSEMVYSSLLCVCMGCGLFLIDRFRPAFAVVLAISVGLAWAVRPAGLVLVVAAVYLLLLLLKRNSFRRLAAWLIVPIAMFLGLLVVAHQLVRGPGLPSQAGRMVFGQVAFLFDSAQVAPEDRAMGELIAATLAPHRAEFEAQPDSPSRHTFAMNNYPARVIAVDEALDAVAGDFRTREALLLRLAIDVIRERPLAYIQWVAEDIAWAWGNHVLEQIRWTPADGMEAYAASEPDRIRLLDNYDAPFTLAEVTVDPQAADGLAGRIVEAPRRILAAVLLIPGLIQVIGVLSLIAAVWAPFASSPQLRGLAFIAATVHISIALTSATTVSIPRYVLPTDILLIVVFLMGAHFIFLRAFRARRAAAVRLAAS